MKTETTETNELMTGKQYLALLDGGKTMIAEKSFDKAEKDKGFAKSYKGVTVCLPITIRATVRKAMGLPDYYEISLWLTAEQDGKESYVPYKSYNEFNKDVLLLKIATISVNWVELNTTVNEWRSDVNVN